MSNRIRRVSPILAVVLVMLSISILISPLRGVVAVVDPATPDTAGLYGGTVTWIEVLDLGDNLSRVFVSTQSANSIFYADIDHTQADPFSDVVFKIVPDLDAEAGYGVIQTFAVDDASGWLYFAWSPQDQSEPSSDNSSQPGIYKCTVEPGSLARLEFEADKDDGSKGMGWVNSLMIQDGHMLFVEQNWSQEKQTDVSHLRFGTIDPTDGSFTEDAQSGIYLRDNNKSQLMAPVINPISNLVYIMDGGNHWVGNDVDAVIYKSSDAYDALSSSTTFSQITPPSGTSEMARQYQSLGIAPDGVIYLAGWQQTSTGYNESIVLYSADDGASWETGTRDQYCWAWQGPNFAFVNDGSGGYDVITGNMVSDDGGIIWGMLPRTGNVWPHPGAIAFDPNSEETLYVKTDRGVAVSNDAGYSFAKAWERPDQTNVEDIEVIDLGGNKSGIFIRERVNQTVNPGQPNNNSTKVYYAEIDHSTSPPTYGEFVAIPGMGEGTNWEIWSRFTGDSTSGLLFFEGRLTSDNSTTMNGLYKTDGKTEPTLVEIESGYASKPLIYDGHMFYVDSSWGGGYWVNGYWVEGHWEGDPQWVEEYYDTATLKLIEAHWTEGETWVESKWVDGYWVEGQPASNLHFGTLDSEGTFTADGQAKITSTAGLWPERMVINPNDGCIYILNNNMQTGTEIYKSSDAYDALTTSTIFSKIDPPSDTATSYEWRAFGIGLDGRLFLGGWNRSGMNSNTIAYSEDDGTSWETVALENEYSGIGDDFAFIETATGYDAFCGTMVSSDKGIGWTNLPRKDLNKAYPTSSCVQIDPNDPQVLYMPTSRGVGYSTDAGYHFYEMNEGIEAVQIRDLALDASGENGWAVAKSGVYRVSNFNSDPVWSAPMDPDGNGAQYKVVAMDLTDPTGNTVYVGTEWGDRVFKTTDGGSHWKSMGRPQPQIDSTKLAGNWYWPNWCGNISSIAIDPYSDNRVFVGYDTGQWGWGENQEERVFGQLWVIEEGSAALTQDNVTPMMAGPNQQGKDWTQILLRRTDAECKQVLENSQDTNKSYALKGDASVSDILITSENGETVIYVAAYYSDETATPVSDNQIKNNGFYDSYGYPLVYGIYRITGDSNSGWNVETSFDEADTAITALSIDSNGIVYACGKDYNEQTYQDFVDSYKDQARKEMLEREKGKARSEFHNEAHDGFYDELVYKFFGQGEGRKEYGDDKGGWDGRFQELFTQFESKYFTDYSGEFNDAFNAYYDQSFEEFFNSQLLPEFDKEFDKQFKQNMNGFDQFWEFNKPQQGLKTVYKKAVGGDWEVLPLGGLNKAFSMNPSFNNNQATITIGEDPANSEAEVPYVAFNRFIYYLPDNGDKWLLGCEYPMGTEIYVIVGVASSGGVGTRAATVATSSKAETVVTAFLERVGLAPQTVAAADDEGAYLYVGTGTGIYGQFISASAGTSESDSGTTGGSRSILIPVAGAVAGIAVIVAACGVVILLKKRHSQKSA